MEIGSVLAAAHMTTRTINVGNLNHALEACLIGIRRAYVFIGFGVNAADNEYLNTFAVPTLFQAGFSLSSQQISDAKKEFELWIRGRAFSDVLHFFEMYLESLFLIYLRLECLQNSKSVLVAGQEFRAFKKYDSIRKYATVAGIIKDVGDFSSYLPGLKTCRNSLIHYAGIVHDHHCTENGKFFLKWKGVDLFIRYDNGEEEPLIKNMTTKHEGSVLLRFPTRVKEFIPGEVVALAANDIFEICFQITQEAIRLSKSFLKYTEGRGVRPTLAADSEEDPIPTK